MPITIPGKLKNKSNNYEVQINRALWSRIKKIVEQFRKETGMSPWWVAPSMAVKAYETEVAYRALDQEKHEWIRGEQLQLWIRLVNQRHDADATKAIPDGLQRSGRIANDKQIRRLVIEHVSDPKSGPAAILFLKEIVEGDTQDSGNIKRKSRKKPV